jgi:beta-glucanase (GH16 family)
LRGNSRALWAGVTAAAAAVPLFLFLPAAFSTDRSACAIDLAGWTLTFDDEFNTLDAAPGSDGLARGSMRWANSSWWGGGGGIEAANPHAISVEDGHAALKAFKDGDKWQGGDLFSHWPGAGFTQRYGYFEARVKIARGQGAWSSFWLMGADRVDGKPGAAFSEIDILEGQGAEPSHFFTTLHRNTGNWGGSPDRKNPWGTVDHDARVDLSQAYHTYGAMYGPDDPNVTFYFDGKPAARIPKWDTTDLQPMMIVVTNSIGDFGAGFNKPGPATPDPTETDVDYVRVFSREAGAKPVALQPISSPDRADTAPAGAVTATGTVTRREPASCRS